MTAPELSVNDLPPALLELGSTLNDEDLLLHLDDERAADLARTSCAVMHFWVTERRQAIARLEANASVSMRAGLAWLEKYRRHPWNAPVRTQIWISRGQPPTPQDFETPSGYWGQGTFRPARGGVSTTTPLPAGVPTWMRIPGPSEREAPLELTPDAAARVYEVNSADDWRDLVLAYPNLVESSPLKLSREVTIPVPLYMPDWEDVAHDWDGVRFTMRGKLRALFVLQRVLDGYTILNEDSGYEESLWLRWIF